MQEETNQKKLGDLGEHLVAKLENAILSESYYDSTKDMTDSNGKKIEVKTQNRHPYKQCFSIKASGITNVHKCLTVNRLIFVEYDKSDFIKVWECKDRNSNFEYIANEKKMIGWPISKMKLIHTIEDKNLSSQMRSLSNAKEFI